MLESIIDSTFAEGTKNPIFFNFTLQQKQNYLVLLDSLGVEYFEIYLSSFLQEIDDLIQFKKSSDLSIKIIICINNSLNDIEKVIQLQYIDVICVKIPGNVTDNLIDNVTDNLIDNVTDNLKLLRSKLPKVQLQFCISDSFDIETNFLSSLYLSIDDYVDCISIEDTRGNIVHSDIEKMISLIKSVMCSDIDIRCQFSNNNSSSVCNTFFALQEGCKYITTSVFGLGDKNGITDLTGIINRIYTTTPNIKYNLHFLKLLELYTSNILDIPIPISNRHNLVIKDDNINISKHLDDFGLFVFNKDIDIPELKYFLYKYLPRAFNALDDEYIEKLCISIKSDISQNENLYIQLNYDQNIAIRYLLQYIN
jgi:homocitrate synthase